MMKKLLTLAILATSALFTSCAQQSLTGNTYARQEVGQASRAEPGKITNLRNVLIQGSSNTGGIIGAVAGGILGNQMGNNSGQTLATIGGAGLGAFAGSKIQGSASTKKGVEITVKLNNGQSVSITQQYSPYENFRVGDNVNVIYPNGRGRARVSK